MIFCFTSFLLFLRSQMIWGMNTSPSSVELQTSQTNMFKRKTVSYTRRFLIIFVPAVFISIWMWTQNIHHVGTAEFTGKVQRRLIVLRETRQHICQLQISKTTNTEHVCNHVNEMSWPLYRACWDRDPEYIWFFETAWALGREGTSGAWTSGSQVSPGWDDSFPADSLSPLRAKHYTCIPPEHIRQSQYCLSVIKEKWHQVSSLRTSFVNIQTCTTVGLSPDPIRYLGFSQMRSLNASSSPVSTARRSFAVRSCVRGLLNSFAFSMLTHHSAHINHIVTRVHVDHIWCVSWSWRVWPVADAGPDFSGDGLWGDTPPSHKPLEKFSAISLLLNPLNRAPLSITTAFSASLLSTYTWHTSVMATHHTLTFIITHTSLN